MGRLLLAHLAALALYWAAPRCWAVLDVRAFAADGARDSLHKAFHAQRLVWRTASTVLVAVLASVPAPGWAFGISVLGLVLIGASYFFYDFNPRLNRARALAYVGPYYVSFAPRAAWFPDRWLAGRAFQAFPVYDGLGGDDEHTQQLRRAYAAGELHRLGRVVLGAGAAAYAALLGLTLLLCTPCAPL